MKLNRYLLLATLLLLGVGLILGGCAKKDNPFSPNVNNGTGVSEGDLMTAPTFVSPGFSTQMTDLNASVADIQGEVVLTFPQYLDPATINFTNISMDMQPTSGAIAYYPELKKVVITGTWTNSGAWHKITIKTGLHSKAGKPIDGNGNGKQDGSPYDDYVTYFYTGAPVDPAPDLTHPKLIDAGPYGGYKPRYPTLYFEFDNNDIDSNLVRANVTLKDSTGHTYVLKSAGTSGGPGNWRVNFTPTAPDSPLPYSMPFIWSININAIQDTHNNKAVWQSYGYVATLPAVNVQFRTIGQTGDWTPLHCTNASGVTITGPEVFITFDDSLDYTTFNTTTVKVFKGTVGSFTGQIYGRVYYEPLDVAANQVRFTLENAPIGSGTYTVFLSRTLKDNNGLMLDGNGNGIGGETGQPLWNGNWQNKSDDQQFTIIR